LSGETGDLGGAIGQDAVAAPGPDADEAVEDVAVPAHAPFAALAMTA
jgi:hypothetical protein